MEPSEILSLKVLSDPYIYEDCVYFTTNWVEGDKYVSTISRFDGKDVILLNSNKHSRTPELSDGYLFYIKKDGNIEKLIRLDQDKKETTICELQKIIKYKIIGSEIIIIGEDIAKFDDDIFITEKVRYRADGRGNLRVRRKLYSLSFDGVLETIVEGDFDILDFDFYKGNIAFAASIGEDDFALALQDVYIYDRSVKDFKKITNGEGKAILVASDTNGNIAYVGHREGKSLAVSNKLIFPLEGFSVEIGYDIDTVFSDLNPEASNHLKFDNGSIYTIAEEKGVDSLYSFKGNEVKKITNIDGCVRDFDVKDGSLCYIYSNFETPCILVFNGKTYNPNCNFIGTNAELNSRNGIDYWLMLKGKELPTILYIHGGPHNAFGNTFFAEFDFMYKNGFNIVFANPTGSKGYGDEFAKGCIGDWGGRDFRELMEIMIHLRTDLRFIGDFHVTGISYGGFMTCSIITKTDMFKSAITEAPVTNIVSMCGTSDIGFWFNAIEAMVKDPWSKDGFQHLLEISPIYNVKKAKTPMMFIHGENDFRCPIEQSEQMYTALRIMGVKSKFIRLKNESHSYMRTGNPKIKKIRLSEKLIWFREHSETLPNNL